jgi:hypothetical protein
MKIFFILLTSIFLSACTTVVPVKQKFPEAPKALLEKCPDLLQANDNATDISEFLKVIIRNYQLYYECSNKNDGWIDWYSTQKKIMDKSNK